MNPIVTQPQSASSDAAATVVDAAGATGGTWLFDVDGCLVDSYDGSLLRPFAAELLVAVRSAGYAVRIWSAGGGDYARRILDRHGISGLVDGFSDKERGADGHWILPDDLLHSTDVTCVDDQPDGIPMMATKVGVFPYLGSNPHDRALCQIIDLLADDR